MAARRTRTGELRVRVSRDELEQVDRAAATFGETRTEYVRRRLFDDVRPMADDELRALIAAKARGGNMRALEMLARVTPARVAPAALPGEPGPGDPFGELDELSERRASVG